MAWNPSRAKVPVSSYEDDPEPNGEKWSGKEYSA